MKVKVISGVLIFSLALNLAVIGTFVYKRFLGPGPRFHMMDRMDRMQSLMDMDIEEPTKEKIIGLFREFRETNGETLEQIRDLEDELFLSLKGDDANLDKAYGMMEQIGKKRLALGKNVLEQFLKAKSFLSAREQDHFFRMLMKNRPNPRFRRPLEEILKERKNRMEKRQEKN